MRRLGRRRTSVSVVAALVVLIAAALVATIRPWKSSSWVSRHTYLVQIHDRQANRLRLLSVRGGHVSRVLSVPPFWNVSWSADHTAVAGDQSGVLWVFRPNGRARPLLRQPEWNEGDRFWEWAPRGHRLAAQVGPRILLVDALTGRRRDITPPGTISTTFGEPRWSPSRRLLAYVRRIDDGAGCARVDLGVASTGGGRFRPLVNFFRPTSADEKAVASEPLGCGGGREEEALVSAAAALTSWSPDARTLLIAKASGVEGGFGTPLLANVETGVVRRLRGLAGATGVWWSPDGRRLAVAHAGALDVLTAAGRRTAAIRGTRPGRAVAWAPDGRRLAVAAPGGTILTIGADGTGRRMVARADDVVRWWGDGTLAVRHDVDGRWELVEIAAGDPPQAHVVYRGGGIVSTLPSSR